MPSYILIGEEMKKACCGKGLIPSYDTMQIFWLLNPSISMDGDTVTVNTEACSFSLNVTKTWAIYKINPDGTATAVYQYGRLDTFPRFLRKSP